MNKKKHLSFLHNGEFWYSSIDIPIAVLPPISNNSVNERENLTNPLAQTPIQQDSDLENDFSEANDSGNTDFM